MAQLSKAQRWDEMAARIEARYGDCVDRIEVSIPVTDESDARILRGVVGQLQATHREW